MGKSVTHEGSNFWKVSFFLFGGGGGGGEEVVCINTTARNQNGMACSCSALFCSNHCSYELQSGNGITFHYHLLGCSSGANTVCVCR